MNYVVCGDDINCAGLINRLTCLYYYRMLSYSGESQY